MTFIALFSLQKRKPAIKLVEGYFKEKSSSDNENGIKLFSCINP
jgi:hypothetical protein